MTATQAAIPTAGVWQIDSPHSSVIFGITHHAVATFRTGFAGIQGQYDAESGVLSGEARVDSIVLVNPALQRLRGHLLSPDFFDAEQFPTLSFTASELSVSGSELTVVGQLTIRGVTKSLVARGTVTSPRTVRAGDGSVGERFGIELLTVIDRRDFGVSFNNEIAEGVANLGWDVAIEAALELVCSPAAGR
jgi:polyisoprenoid-binding protein YceI